jgi:hypothetical protein
MIAKSAAASIFLDTRGSSRSIEISVPGAFTAVGFSGQQKNIGAFAAERGRPSLFKTIDEDRRERHDYISRSGKSTYPGRFSVRASGATTVQVDPTVEGIARKLIILTDEAFDRALMWREGNDYLTSALPWERLVSEYVELFRGVACSR